jgi:hypothetical protein
MGDTPLKSAKSVKSARMTKADLVAYRERWQLVEDQVYAEARARTIEERWHDLGTILKMATVLRLQYDARESDADRAARQRWLRLKGHLFDREISYEAIPRPRLHRRIRETDSNEIFDFDRLRGAVMAVDQLVRHYNDQGLVIGGVAVSLLARARFTKDVDAALLLDIEQLPDLIMHAGIFGLFPRILNIEEFARESRVLLLIHAESGIEVDLALAVLPFEAEAIDRAVAVQIGTVRLRLPTPEDLIIMKAVSHRMKDLQDIYDIIQTNPGLDRERIRGWLQEFAMVLEMPELWEDIAPWLS